MLRSDLDRVLERATATLRDEGHGTAAARVEANFDDERGVPEPHRALFGGLLAAVGGDVLDEREAAAPVPA